MVEQARWFAIAESGGHNERVVTPITKPSLDVVISKRRKGATPMNTRLALMYLRDASPFDDGCCAYVVHGFRKHFHKQTLPADQLARSLPSPLLCGQSRTTIRARHFASLIGRLWIGGN